MWTPFALQGIQVGRERGDQGLSFACCHFSDLAFVKHNAADELDVVVTFSQGPFCRLPDDGKGLRKNLIQGFPLLDPLFEFSEVFARS